MKMFPAYQKAARLARKHGRALVVTIGEDAHATADHWDAVTVEYFHTPRHQREHPEDLRFFDLVESSPTQNDRFRFSDTVEAKP
ncbi:MAG TPA: hypothetical protein PJ991_05910 [Kiritimatiellia bacterium]|nr:hypothetical protein [Kiritimatiellia bacterium]